MTKPALVPDAADRPMRKPSTKLSTATAVASVTGNGATLLSTATCACASFEPLRTRRPSFLMRLAAAIMLAATRSRVEPELSSGGGSCGGGSSCSLSCSARLGLAGATTGVGGSSTSQNSPSSRKRAMPSTKPTVIAAVFARSFGASLMMGTSSTATAQVTMPAARCCSAAIRTFGAATP